MHKRPLFWIILFGFLFFLSMDFWRWDDPVKAGILNFPGWLGYFVILSLVLSFSLYLFGKFYGTDNHDSR